MTSSGRIHQPIHCHYPNTNFIILDRHISRSWICSTFPRRRKCMTSSRTCRMSFDRRQPQKRIYSRSPSHEAIDHIQANYRIGEIEQVYCQHHEIVIWVHPKSEGCRNAWPRDSTLCTSSVYPKPLMTAMNTSCRMMVANFADHHSHTVSSSGYCSTFGFLYVPSRTINPKLSYSW